MAESWWRETEYGSSPAGDTPWYVLCLALFPVLFLYAHNFEETPVRDLLIPLAVTVGGTAVLYVGLLLISRSKWVASAIVAILVVSFFGYRAISVFLEQVGLPIRHRWMLLIAGGVVVLASWLAFRAGDRTRALVRPLNVFGFVLLAFIAASLSYKSLLARDDAAPELAGDGGRAWAANPAQGSPVPRHNVYYIVLDGYARNDVLRSYFGYDNEEFTTFLVTHGFVVNPQSRANYDQTYPSLASSLNGGLLPGPGSPALWRGMIQRSAVTDFFRERGYRVVNVRSGWGPTAFLPGADANVGCGAPSEFSEVLLRSTAAWPALASPAMGGLFSPHSSRLCALRMLGDLAATSDTGRPKLVLAHILLPHPPFVFGANGERLSDFKPMSAPEGWADRDAYTNQLVFLNKSIRGIIETLLANDRSDPVVIIQGDHGSASSPGWIAREINPRLVRERMPIFSAIRLPKNERLPLDRFVTPVNTFGGVFERYFGTRFVPQPDASFFRFQRVDSLLTEIAVQN